jgi:hypothetical protein
MSPKKKRQLTQGTGRRYVSTRPKLQVAPVRRTPPPPSYAEKSLRKHISRFGLSERFHDDFEKAFELYMGPGSIQKQGDRNILVMDEVEDDFPGFQEWFYFDYVLQSKDHIIDLFAQEMGPQLGEAQRQILEDWLATNRQRLLETQSVEPGIGETVQDLLSGEVFQLNDISFSYAASRWSIALARSLLTEGRWAMTGSGMLLTPLEKPSLLKAAKNLWAEYKAEHPQASLDEFYRDHSLDLRRAALEIQEKQGRPQTVMTGEGHPAISARAEYSIKGDTREIESVLDRAEEFVYQNEQRGGEFSGSLYYIWLLRGRSRLPEAPVDQQSSGGIKFSGSWTAGPGQPDFRTLGDLYVGRESIVLLCLSRERLEAGKQLLGEMLGTKIQHQQDYFEELEQTPEDLDQEYEDEIDTDEFEVEELDAEARQVEEELIERTTLRWLDTPDAKGVTPRQAAQTAEGREELQETLKAIEFIGQRALKSGKRPPMRLDIIRRELGL